MIYNISVDGDIRVVPKLALSRLAKREGELISLYVRKEATMATKNYTSSERTARAALLALMAAGNVPAFDWERMKLKPIVYQPWRDGCSGGSSRRSIQRVITFFSHHYEVQVELDGYQYGPEVKRGEPKYAAWTPARAHIRIHLGDDIHGPNLWHQNCGCLSVWIALSGILKHDQNGCFKLPSVWAGEA